MKPWEHLGDREHPVVDLVCQECGETVFTSGTMTFGQRRAVLDIETPDHEHEILFEKRIVTE